jgi:hypothetical protein
MDNSQFYFRRNLIQDLKSNEIIDARSGIAGCLYFSDIAILVMATP